MSTIKLNTDSICLGHLASNARSLQENSQSERACYCSHIIKKHIFRSPKGNGKKIEIAGLRDNRGSVKGKSKSKGIRSSFEIAGTSN